jgi:hypothetical protein
MTIEVNPQMGVDTNGTYRRCSWADCATALAVILDNLEVAQPIITDVIEAEINGLTNGDTDTDDTDPD